MRITVEAGRDDVRLGLSGAGVAETRALAEGIAADYDAQGRLVGLALREVARLSGTGDALAELRIDLAGEAARPAADAPAPPTQHAAPPPPASPRAPAAPRPLTPAERAALGPLTWEPEAEAAMERVPFFQRGARRRAVVERARAHGLSRVTAAMVEEAPGL